MISMIKIDEFISKLDPKKKMLFMITVSFVAIALMDRLMVGPALSQMKQIDSENATKKENIKHDRRIVSFREKILKEYSKYSTYLDSGKTDQEEIIASLLKKIETLAAQRSITISNIKSGDVEEKPLYHIYKTSIDCEGSLSNILAFMNLMEQSDYLFQISTYRMAPKSKGADIIKCSLDVARILITAEKAGAPPPAETAQ